MVGPDAMSLERAGECTISEGWAFEDSVAHVNHACMYERCSWDNAPGSRGFLAYVEDHTQTGITGLSNLRDALEELLSVVNVVLEEETEA